MSLEDAIFAAVNNHDPWDDQHTWHEDENGVMVLVDDRTGVGQVFVSKSAWLALCSEGQLRHRVAGQPDRTRRQPE